MQIAFIAAILLYMLSSAAYFAYLFIQRDRLQQIGGLLLMVGFAGHRPRAGQQSSRNAFHDGLGRGRGLSGVESEISY